MWDGRAGAGGVRSRRRAKTHTGFARVEHAAKRPGAEALEFYDSISPGGLAAAEGHLEIFPIPLKPEAGLNGVPMFTSSWTFVFCGRR